MAEIALGVGGTLLLLVVVPVVRLATRGWGTTQPAEPLQVAAEPTTHVGAQDDAATTAWLADVARNFDTDDSQPIDVRRLIAAQDWEIGVEFVRRIEAELAAGFGWSSELAGVGAR